MKKILIPLFIFLFCILQAQDPLKPYILIGETGKKLETSRSEIIGALFMNGYKILGKYAPADDPNRFVIIYTHSDLIEILKDLPPNAAFLAAQQIDITKKGEMTYVACPNPLYWGHALLPEVFGDIAPSVESFHQEFLKQLPRMRMRANLPYGAAVGLTTDELHNYKYKKKSPVVGDTVLLRSGDDSGSDSSSFIDLISNSDVMEVVYNITTSPNSDVRVVGITLPDTFESDLLAQFDTGDRRVTSFLPIKLLEIEGSVYMLSMQYSLPVGFPDMDKKQFKKVRQFDERIQERLKEILRNP